MVVQFNRCSNKGATHRRRYGYRRITAELQQRGFPVNGKRVLRLLREDNLLSLRQRKFVVTTQSQPGLEIYLNLARRMKLTDIDRLWVADITYIRLRTEFVYLAVMLDAYSRKVIGWALDRSLTTALILTALQQALRERQPPPGLCIIPTAGCNTLAPNMSRFCSSTASC